MKERTMIELRLLLIGTLIVFSYPGNGPPQLAVEAQTRSIRIAAIRDSDAFDGAGCSLQLLAGNVRTKNRMIFESNYEGDALMNIDGEDIKLRLVRGHEPNKRPGRGDRSTFAYRAGDIGVRVDFVVTGVCAPEDESCEVTQYTATIRISRGKSKRVVKAVGICGS
jgi:hypothetical protein